MGTHFKIRPPNKDDAFPQGVSRAGGGAAPTVGVYRIQTSDALSAKTGEQRAGILFEPAGQESPTSARSFSRVGPATVGAAEGALGWGRISKFGPRIKMM